MSGCQRKLTQQDRGNEARRNQSVQSYVALEAGILKGFDAAILRSKYISFNRGNLNLELNVEYLLE